MADPPRVVVDGLATFQKNLKRFDAGLLKEFRKEMKDDVVRPVLHEAMANASWSARIPRSLGMTVTNKAVGIKIRDKYAPHGSILERGNKDSRPGTTTFRHPVFGNRSYWVVQPTRPFLWPAVQAALPRVRGQVDDMCRKYARRAGF